MTDLTIEQVIEWIDKACAAAIKSDYVGAASVVPMCEATESAISMLKATLPKPEWGPWIGWNGGEKPVSDKAVGEVVILCPDNKTHIADIMTFHSKDASLSWMHEGRDSSAGVYYVIAYRVKANTPKTITETWWRLKSKPNFLYADGIGKHGADYEKVTVTFKAPQ